MSFAPWHRRRLEVGFSIFLLLGTNLTFAADLIKPSPVKLTLAEAVAKTMSNSITSKRSALSIEQARLNSSLVGISADPKIGLTGAWGSKWQRKSSDSPPSLKAITRIHSYSAEASYALYDFGRQNAKELSARESSKAAELARDEVEEELFWLVLRAYQDVASAERIVAISKEQLDVSNDKRTELSKNYKQGLRPESDVVTAEVDLGRARIAFQAAADDAYQARRNLTRLMNPEASPGDDHDRSDAPAYAVIAGGVAEATPESWDEFAGSIEKASAERPTAKALAAAKEALKAEDAAIDASIRPVLNGVLGSEWSNEGAQWAPLHPSASGQLQLSWDVPWNGMTRLSKAIVSLKRSDVDLREVSLRQETTQNIDQARTLLVQAKKMFESLREQIKLVKRQRQLVQARYRAGQASALELSTAEAALLGVRLDQAKLSNNVATGLISLAQARGARVVELLQRL